MSYNICTIKIITLLLCLHLMIIIYIFFIYKNIMKKQKNTKSNKNIKSKSA